MTIKGIWGGENLIYMYDKSKHDQIKDHYPTCTVIAVNFGKYINTTNNPFPSSFARIGTKICFEKEARTLIYN